MNCYICKNRSKFTCSCISPNVFICKEHFKLHTSGSGNHVFWITKSMDLFPILLKDLKMLRVKIIAKSHFKIKEIVDQTKKSIQEFNNFIKNLKKSTDLFPILLNDLKMIRVKIIANSFFEIKKIQEQANNTIKEINSCMKNLKRSRILMKLTC